MPNRIFCQVLALLVKYVRNKMRLVVKAPVACVDPNEPAWLRWVQPGNIACSQCPGS